MTLEEWYFNNNTTVADLTDERFYELLDLLKFELIVETLQNGVAIYYMRDLHGINLANIEQDIFYANHNEYRGMELSYEDKLAKQWLDIKSDIIGRLEVYLYDYFERN